MEQDQAELKSQRRLALSSDTTRLLEITKSNVAKIYTRNEPDQLGGKITWTLLYQVEQLTRLIP
jgi:hypothetical protein